MLWVSTSPTATTPVDGIPGQDTYERPERAGVVSSVVLSMDKLTQQVRLEWYLRLLTWITTIRTTTHATSKCCAGVAISIMTEQTTSDGFGRRG
jgi:hypothetical protein